MNDYSTVDAAFSVVYSSESLNLEALKTMVANDLDADVDDATVSDYLEELLEELNYKLTAKYGEGYTYSRTDGAIYGSSDDSTLDAEGVEEALGAAYGAYLYKNGL